MSDTIPPQVPPVTPQVVPVTPVIPTAELSWAKPVIAVFIMSIFVIVYILAYLAKNETTQTLMAGCATTLISTLVSYYFGSSSGSARKSEITDATTTAVPIVPSPLAPVPTQTVSEAAQAVSAPGAVGTTTAAPATVPGAPIVPVARPIIPGGG